MDEFAEGSSSEEEEQQPEEASLEESSESEKEETEQNAATASDSDVESKASSAGVEEESGSEQEGSEDEETAPEEIAKTGSDDEEEESFQEPSNQPMKEASDSDDEYMAPQPSGLPAHEGSGSDDDEAAPESNAEQARDSDSDSSDAVEEGDAATPAEASGEGSDAAGSVGGQTPTQSDSDGEEAAKAEKSGSDEEEEIKQESEDEDNRETRESEEEEGARGKVTAESSDSGSDVGGKRRKIQDTDSSDEEATEPQSTANLFGDADDISSSDEEKVKSDEEPPAKPVAFSDDEADDGLKQQQQPMEEEQQETRIEVEIPKINTDLGNSIHFVRFPNFVSVETRPFDPVVYEDEIEDDELMDEEGRTRLKLKVENTIRWKKYVDDNGISLTESNARLVRWSDGTMSMHLGSEIFDVHVMSLQGDHNHLFIRQGTGLQGQAVFKTKLTFRPHSTKSATHRKMTSRLAMRLNQNQQKVRVLPIAGQDPESRKAKLMKEEEDQLRAHMRREAQKRRMREKAHARGLNTNYLDDRLDEDDDSGAISVAAIKNKFKPGFGGPGRNIYTSESDSGDEKQLTNAKRLESDDSDDDAEKKKRSDEGEKKKKYVVSDSESDNEDNKETTAETSENPTAGESQEQASDSDE